MVKTIPDKRLLTVLVIVLLVGSVMVGIFSLGRRTYIPDSKAEVSWNHLSSKQGEIPTPLGSEDQTASLVMDIDKDGLNDFVIASRDAINSVVWFKRTNSGWQQYVIDDRNLSLEAGGDFYDIDQDGDLDISFGGDNGSNKIYWWENPYPEYSQGTNWESHTLKNSGANKHHDQMFGDVDGDGVAELVFWNQKGSNPGLYMAEIPENPQLVDEWSIIKIYDATDKHEGLSLIDIDNNQKLDIVGAGLWFEHTSGMNFTPHVIDDSRAFTRVAAGQLKEGGRPEVVFSAGDQSGTADIYTWENSTWNKTKLFDVVNGHSLEIQDINNDGYQDIFSAEMRLNGENPDSKVRILYGDGSGSFQTTIVSTGIGVHEGKIADLDGDGDIDILGKPYNWDTPRVDVWLQEGEIIASITPTVVEGSLDSWQKYLISGDVDRKMLAVTALDMDGDEKKDIISGSYWWKQPANISTTWQRNNLPSGLDNFIVAGDYDDGGGLDLLGTRGTTHNAHDLVWARKVGNDYNLLDNIDDPNEGDFTQDVEKVIVGNDEYLAVSWHRPVDHELHFYKLNGATDVWALTTQNNIISQNEDLSVGDIDDDGDEDLFQGTKWVRNNGQISNWTQHVVDASLENLDTDALPDRNILDDFDDDGDLDAIVGLEKGTKILFYENSGELETNPNESWNRREIYNILGEGFSMDYGDIDMDGDFDVVLGEHKGDPNNRVIILENKNNASDWDPHIIDSDSEENIDHHNGTQLHDIDEDGDLDILSIGWLNQKVWLYENTSTSSVDNTPTPDVSPTPKITPSLGNSPTPVPLTTPSPSVTSTPMQTPFSSPTLTPTSRSGIACGRADVDNNSTFDLIDFVAFAEVYLNDCTDSASDFGVCGGKDTDRNYFIDISDFVSFAGRYAIENTCRP